MKHSIILLLFIFCMVLLSTERLLWDSENNYAGWGRPNNLELTRKGCLRLKVTGRDPWMIVDTPPVNTNDFIALELKYRALSKIGERPWGGFYFQTGDDKAFTAEKHISYGNLEYDGKWHVIRINLDLPMWQKAGVLRSLRYDPMESSSGELEVDYIALIPSNETYRGYLEDVENDRFTAFQYNYKVCKEHPAHGHYCMEQGEKEDGEEMARSTIAFPVKPSTFYRVSVQHRNTIAQGKIVFAAVQSRESPEFKATGSRDWKMTQLTCNASEWHRVELRLRTASDTHGLTIYFKTTSNGLGRAWWDDLRIEEVQEEEPPLEIDFYPPQVSFIDQPLSHAECIYLNGRRTQSSKWIQEAIDSIPLTVRCRDNRQGCTLRLEISHADTLKHTETREAARVNHFSLPIDTLAAGRYELAVELHGPDGSKLRRESFPLYRFRPFTPEKLPPIQRVETDNHNVLVNGRPFHKIYLSHFPKPHLRVPLASLERLDRYTELAQRFFGLNAIHIEIRRQDEPRRDQPREAYLQSAISFYSDAYLKELEWCKAHNLYGIASLQIAGMLHGEKPDLELIRGIARKIGGHPALLEWNYDEPEVHKLSPVEVAAMVQATKGDAFFRPVCINLCQPWRFSEFVPHSDIVSYDNYPFPHSNLEDKHLITEKMKEAACGRPFQNYLQVFQFEQVDTLPTREQILASFVMDAIDDCRSLKLYSWCEGPAHSMLADRSLQSHATIVANYAHELFPFIDNAVQERIDLKEEGSVLSSCWRKGEERCLLVVNLHESKTAEITLPQADAITDFFDGAWKYQPSARYTLQPCESLVLRVLKQ